MQEFALMQPLVNAVFLFEDHKIERAAIRAGRSFSVLRFPP